MIRDLREYIEAQLSLHELGRLVYIKGPDERRTHFEGIGYREHWGITVKYRPFDGKDQFDDHRIDINIGGNARGGWINQRSIRLAIAAEAEELKKREFVNKRWASAQRAITSGPWEL